MPRTALESAKPVYADVLSRFSGRSMASPLIGKFGTFEYSLADKYRFESELGRGGMGTVYRARDVRHSRMVAIKMLHASLTNDYGVLRFQKEIEIAAQLEHPNIVRLLDSGVADGRLYYVMSYLDGESLRDKLKREPQLSVEEALTITQQVGEALQYAHDRRIVHRDVKPENIIIADGRAHVVDFGLARALSAADADRLTASGLAVGTPHYMAPEQAAGEKHVGPFADQYALACMLYEMLVGEPPFTGASATAVATRHQLEVPVPLCVRRKTTPKQVEAAVMQALEKVPTDRCESVSALLRKLSSTAAYDRYVGAAAPRWQSRWLALSIVATLLVGIAVAARATADGYPTRCLVLTCLDTSRYAILSWRSPATRVELQLGDKLYNAFDRWNGVHAVAGGALSIRDRDPGEDQIESARAIARRLKAGRFLIYRGAVRDSLIDLTVDVFDTKRRESLRRAATEYSASSDVADSAIGKLVANVLFDQNLLPGNSDALQGTTNPMAFDAFLRARFAANHWSLSVADTEFVNAIRLDPYFPQALLGLAEVRSWASDDSLTVVDLVDRALDRRDRMNEPEVMRAEALRFLYTDSAGKACALYEHIVRQNAADAGAWIGIGQCNLRDNEVVQSARPPGGRAFRGSFERSATAFQTAFRLFPTLDPCCAERAFELMDRPLFVSGTRIRRGVAPDSNVYVAYPELINDTVGFSPQLYGRKTLVPPLTHMAAVDRMRREHFGIAQRRRELFPRSPESLADLALAMDLLGDPSAADTMSRARLVARGTSERIRFGGAEAWMRAKTAIPTQLHELGAVRTLVDSLLSSNPQASGESAGLLASLAALVGRAELAAQLSTRVSPKINNGLPRSAYIDAAALLTFSAVGRPIDSIAAVEARLASTIKNGVLQSQQRFAWNALVSQAAALAYPFYRMSIPSELGTNSDYLLAAEAAHARHDTTAVKRILKQSAADRANLRAGDVTLDAIYPEVWLLAQVGDSIGARTLLTNTLSALPTIPVQRLMNAVSAGSLVQLMILQARLEPTVAKDWQGAVRILRDP